MTQHHIGHRATNGSGKAVVECTCGAVLGFTRRSNSNRGGYVYDCYDDDLRRFACGLTSMAPALKAFEAKFPEHTS